MMCVEGKVSKFFFEKIQGNVRISFCKPCLNRNWLSPPNLSFQIQEDKPWKSLASDHTEKWIIPSEVCIKGLTKVLWSGHTTSVGSLPPYNVLKSYKTNASLWIQSFKPIHKYSTLSLYLIRNNLPATRVTGCPLTVLLASAVIASKTQ